MTDNSVAARFKLAVEHYQRGELADAESICREIVAAAGNHAGAMRLLGVLLLQAGKHAEAQEHLRRVTALAPTWVEAHNELASSLAASGQFDEAVVFFRRARQLAPANADIAVNLGMVLLQSGAFAEAAEVFATAVSLRPADMPSRVFLGDALRELGRFADAVTEYEAAGTFAPFDASIHLRLGVALKAQGRVDDALNQFRRAAELSPGLAEAHFNLGNALKASGRLEEAVHAYTAALAARPDYGDALHNLATVYGEQQKWDDAISMFGRVLQHRPDFLPALNGLASALRMKGEVNVAVEVLRRALAVDPGSFDTLIALADLSREDEALSLYRRALELRPNDVQTLAKCGKLLDRDRNPDAAIEMYDRALALRPDFAEARLYLAFNLLRAGKFKEGWDAYESRWQLQKRNYDNVDLPQPFWNGEDLRGRRLLLHLEQGFGDSIQFIRYVPILAARGARIIVRCRPSLGRLFSQGLGIERLLDAYEPLPDFDYQLPLLSVPRVLGTTADTIPANVPYLMPPVEVIEFWRHRLGKSSAGFKVGLVWAGGASHDEDGARSLQLAALEPILSLRKLEFYSLQKGAPRCQLVESPAVAHVNDLSDDLHDFADTAGAILSLDLVICVDTAVAHLSGALGRPTWMLLSYASEWRWLGQRSDSPWYPTMRIFNQPCRGDWNSLAQRIAAELRVVR